MKKTVKTFISLFIVIGSLIVQPAIITTSTYADNPEDDLHKIDCSKEKKNRIEFETCELQKQGWECATIAQFTGCKNSYGDKKLYDDKVLYPIYGLTEKELKQIIQKFLDAPMETEINTEKKTEEKKTEEKKTENKTSNNNTSTTTTADVDASFEGGDCNRTFLGLIPWDCNVSINNEATLKSGIWQIVANIATDITIIAAYLVIGYVIYGGYLYMFSEGDPNKVSTGKKTITQAFIGLAIVMSAYIIMNAIRFALLGSSGKLDNCAVNSCVDATSLVTNAIQWIIGVSGIVALIFVIYGGVVYATSAGDPNKLQKAKNAILYALIGLAIVALAEIITAFVSSAIRHANNTAFNQQVLISKEINEKTKNI